MGDPLRYPEIRSQRFVSVSSMPTTHKWLPPSVRDNYELCGAWVRNNMAYLDSLLLELYLDKDHCYMRFTWLDYHITSTSTRCHVSVFISSSSLVSLPLQGHAGGGDDGGDELYEVKCSTPLQQSWSAGHGSAKGG
eukprot:scaffold16638_cov120-Isochrysis_galbana.AAC.1